MNHRLVAGLNTQALAKEMTAALERAFAAGLAARPASTGSAGEWATEVKRRWTYVVEAHGDDDRTSELAGAIDDLDKLLYPPHFPVATPPPMEREAPVACGKNYGPLPAMCRRPPNHAGDCGSGSEAEQVIAQFNAARERVRHLAERERLGEDIGDLHSLVLRRGSTSREPTERPSAVEVAPAGAVDRWLVGYLAALQNAGGRFSDVDSLEEADLFGDWLDDEIGVYAEKVAANPAALPLPAPQDGQGEPDAKE